VGLFERSDGNLYVGADLEADVVLVLAFGGEDGGRFPQASDDLSSSGGEVLAGTDKERHALPAPGVDVEAHGDEGLDAGVLGDAGLVEVALELAEDDVFRLDRQDAARIAPTPS
jgi:hypothetical protein